MSIDSRVWFTVGKWGSVPCYASGFSGGFGVSLRFFNIHEMRLEILVFVGKNLENPRAKLQ